LKKQHEERRDINRGREGRRVEKKGCVRKRFVREAV